MPPQAPITPDPMTAQPVPQPMAAPAVAPQPMMPPTPTPSYPSYNSAPSSGGPLPLISAALGLIGLIVGGIILGNVVGGSSVWMQLIPTAIGAAAAGLGAVSLGKSGDLKKLALIGLILGLAVTTTAVTWLIAQKVGESKLSSSYSSF
ncbi:MAG TPA: hypothetical protein VG992_04475 [Candidatus Saccharimonadales bacterium]|nr:hypothetical protein [Candidatus Saccharimonadales bacterium]